MKYKTIIKMKNYDIILHVDVDENKIIKKETENNIQLKNPSGLLIDIDESTVETRELILLTCNFDIPIFAFKVNEELQELFNEYDCNVVIIKEIKDIIKYLEEKENEKKKIRTKLSKRTQKTYKNIFKEKNRFQFNGYNKSRGQNNKKNATFWKKH